MNSDNVLSIFILVFGLGFFLFVIWIIQKGDEDRWKRKMIELHETRMAQLFKLNHGDSNPKDK